METIHPSGVDVLVLAGDVAGPGQLDEVLRAFCSRYPDVVYVIGNHELYGSGFPAVRQSLESLRGLSNLHWLDNSTVTIKGQRFVGTTLWFGDRPDNHRYAQEISDFSLIEDFSSNVYRENRTAVSFLSSAATVDDIVVTHHLPSVQSVQVRFFDSPLNRFFVCAMDDLIRQRRPRLWFHGHTHTSCDYAIGRTRVVCNPYGYLGYETNAKFDARMVIHVPTSPQAQQ
jgi:Icc-related predicted phosphoesterase